MWLELWIASKIKDEELVRKLHHQYWELVKILSAMRRRLSQS